MDTYIMMYQRYNYGPLQITFREEVRVAFWWTGQSWGRAAQVTNCKCMLSWGTKSLCEGRAAQSTPPSTQGLVWREQGYKSPSEPTPQYICALADVYCQLPETLLRPLILCVLPLLGNTLCSSCLSRSQSFLSSSPIPLWETLHCTWPSFQSGATFTDVSSLCLIVPYLGWERACPIIAATKPNQAHVRRLLQPPRGVWREACFFWW